MNMRRRNRSVVVTSIATAALGLVLWSSVDVSFPESEETLNAFAVANSRSGFDPRIKSQILYGDVPLVQGLQGSGSTHSQLTRRAFSGSELDAVNAAAGSGAFDPVIFGLQGIFGLAALYSIMSASEYIYHRYLQHLGINRMDISRTIRTTFDIATYRGDGHVEHHRETLDDMTLDVIEGREPVLDACPWRGTSFPWAATAKMATGVMILSYPVLSLIGWSGSVIIPVVLSAVLLHALVWNALHPAMHGLPDVPLSHGAPSFLLAGFRDTPLFNFLRSNHVGHHLAEGAHGNYNVCCPGTDFALSTNVDVRTGKPLPSQMPPALVPLVAILFAPLAPVFIAQAILIMVTSSIPQPAAASSGK